MAGSLPGVPLAQQFDANGKALAGCLLYIYAANTTTPQDSFQDQGLTLKNPWPLQADARGRVPMFYLADGSVHVRLTDSVGVVQFDYLSMLVIGPSSGGGGGGGVDATTIFATGDCVWFEAPGTRAGWVRDNGRTIGSAVSGATERANADVSALYVYLWNNYADAVCPVISGRGASGLADFNANKQITLPDKRGYSPIGDTAMGNADSARLAGVPFASGSSTVAGSKCGEALHTLSTPEIPAHNHTGTAPDHTHPLTGVTGAQSGARGPGPGDALGSIGGSGATLGSGALTLTIANAGGGGSHNNTQLGVIGTFFRKL